MEAESDFAAKEAEARRLFSEEISSFCYNKQPEI